MFHYTQAVWRWCFQHGVAPHFRHNPKVRGIIFMAFSLPFLPLPEIDEGVEEIQDEISNVLDGADLEDEAQF